MLKNQSGLITLDFIFALVLVFAFTAILFTISLTLSVVEVTQYITFASSRNYFAAHKDESKMRELGEEKFKQLSNEPFFKPLFNNGWFELKDFKIGQGTAYQALDSEPDRFTFYGASVFLRAPVLNFKVPIFGRTAADADSASEAQIASWLAREPSQQECAEFNEARMQLIKKIGGNSYSASQINENMYVVQSDNGC